MNSTGNTQKMLTRHTAFLVACLALCSVSGQGEPISTDQFLAGGSFRGGLVVHVGMQDPALVLSIAQAPNVLGQGLVRDGKLLGSVRSRIREAGLYGRVSALEWQGPSLPYADGMVNLLVVTSEDELVAGDEAKRVLAPGGTVLFPNRKWVKPVPADVDQWTHARYDATGNAVSKDKRVGPPQFLQWEAVPRWNYGVKTSSLVTSEGRVFYILDDSSFASNSHAWALIARDAFNGVQLWRHELPSWAGAQGGKKVGPAQVNRLLVAVDERVYAPLEEGAPLSVLDAATGQVVRQLDDTAKTQEFVVSNGVLVALTEGKSAAEIRRGAEASVCLVAVNPDTGERLWKQPSTRILPLTVAADGTQVVYHDGSSIRSLDLKTGAPRWTSPPTGQKIVFREQANADSPGAERGSIVLAPQFAPTLMMFQGVVAFAGGRQLNVVSASDGHELWRADYAPSNYSVPVDLFGFQGLLWGPDVGMNQWRPDGDNVDFNAYNPLTGAIEKTVKGNYGFRFQHHRCHQMKVIGETVMCGRAAIELLDTRTGQLTAQHWLRGSCYYGEMPANGLLYVPPNDCACYIRAKLSGFMALAAGAPSRPAEISADRRLQQGPAYGQTAAVLAEPCAEDWPAYRHDAARSGVASTKVGTGLLLGWEKEVGETLTSPVIADNRLYVASTDSHTLYALDATTGAPLWEYTLNARVDSPPTVYQGLVLFGCHDGSVSALRATDGALVWRFLAGPAERFIVSRGQLESVWPVNGSVLVSDHAVYFAAGKSSYLDHGMRFYGLEPHTGRKLLETRLWTRSDDGSERIDDQGVDGFLNDILSSNGKQLFMRHQILDRQGNPQPGRIPHLHCPDGYLSADTTSRLVWIYAPLFTSPHQGAFYDLRLSRALFPSGRILVEDEDTIYGFGQNHYAKMKVEPGGQWALFAAAKDNGVPLDLSAKDYRALALSGKQGVKFRWWRPLPIQVWGMVKTADALFVAGPPGSAGTTPAALEGKAEGRLLAVSPADGQVLADVSLPAMPVWDGMAAANGNLYLALANGQVLCLWPAAAGRPGKPLSAAGWGVELPPLAVAEEPGLLGHWRFDEGAGLVARDCSGGRHDATVSGRWAKGDSGACLAADGVPNAAVIPDDPSFQFGNRDFTIAWWVKVDGYDVRLLGKEAFPDNWWTINVLPTGRAELVLAEGRGPGLSVRLITVEPVATGAWTHLVAVVDRQAQEARWYVNGSPSSRCPIPGTMTKGLTAAGRNIALPSSGKSFRGLIGDFRLYEVALDSKRVAELYQAAAGRYASTAFRVGD